MKKNQSKHLPSQHRPKVNIVLYMMFAIVILINIFLIYQIQQQPKVAYVQTAVLLEQYPGMVAARQDFEQKSQIWQANLDTLSSEIQQAMADYEATHQALSSTEKYKRQQEIAQKRGQFTKYQQAVQQQVQEADQQMSESVFNQLNSYIEEYGKTYGYDIIMGATGNGNLLYGKESMDITDDLMDYVKKKYEGE